MTFAVAIAIVALIGALYGHHIINQVTGRKR